MKSETPGSVKGTVGLKRKPLFNTSMIPVGRLNLLADKTRFAAAVAGVAFAVGLILLIQALYSGYRHSVRSFVETVPVDLWVGQAGAFDLFRSTTNITPGVATQVASTPGVAAMGKLRARQSTFTSNGRTSRSLFLSFDRLAAAGAAQTLGLKELPQRGEVVISDYIHKKSGVSVGDKVEVNGKELTVIRVLALDSPPYGSFSVVNYDDADAIFGMQGNASFLMLALDDQGREQDLASAIRMTLPSVSVYTKTEFATSNALTIDETLPVIGVLLSITYVVGTVITGLTIYTATIEKSRDYGVLKAIGARNSYIYRIVVHQSLVVSVLGFCIGLPLAFLASRMAAARVPEFITQFDPVAAAGTFAAVLIMGLLASLLPARRIAAIDPAIVFRA